MLSSGERKCPLQTDMHSVQSSLPHGRFWSGMGNGIFIRGRPFNSRTKVCLFLVYPFDKADDCSRVCSMVEVQTDTGWVVLSPYGYSSLSTLLQNKYTMWTVLSLTLLFAFYFLSGILIGDRVCFGCKLLSITCPLCEINFFPIKCCTRQTVNIDISRSVLV